MLKRLPADEVGRSLLDAPVPFRLLDRLEFRCGATPRQPETRSSRSSGCACRRTRWCARRPPRPAGPGTSGIGVARNSVRDTDPQAPGGDPTFPERAPAGAQGLSAKRRALPHLPACAFDAFRHRRLAGPRGTVDAMRRSDVSWLRERATHAPGTTAGRAERRRASRRCPTDAYSLLAGAALRAALRRAGAARGGPLSDRLHRGRRSRPAQPRPRGRHRWHASPPTSCRPRPSS